jgi:multidrug efflux pump subunit AcrA (membrane-fusion protein)
MLSKASRRGWVLALALAGVVCLAVLGRGLLGDGPAAAGPEPPRPDSKAVAVTVEPVTARAVQRTVAVVGSLYGCEEVALTPKVEGRVVKIYHDIGDVVRPGELLLEIDPTDYRLAAEELRRALELELAKLGLKELPARELDVRSLPSVARAEAQEKNAAARRDRTQRVGKGSSSTEERETAQTELAVARANYLQALLDARSTLAAARHRKAALETALQKLEDCKVRAPGVRTGPESDPNAGAGPEYVVCQRSVSEGEIVRTIVFGDQSVLFKLAIDRPLKFRAMVPERHRAEVKVGQAVELEVEAYPGEKFTGAVARVNPMVDRASRTFQVEVRVPNGDRRLSPGSFARARIRTRIDPQARTIPEEALVTFAGVTKAFVVREGKARAVGVRPGVAVPVAGEGSGRTWVEVTGELPVGAQVVTSGQSQLTDGTPVRLRGSGRQP